MNTINILLIDDEERWVPLLNDIIKNEPKLILYRVANNSITALEIVGTEPIDLILLDYHLGENDIWGNQLVTKLLKLKQKLNQNVPIIFWSVHMFEGILIKAKKAGAAGYINKIPSDANTINQLLIKAYEDSKNNKESWIEHPSYSKKLLKHQFTPREQEILYKIAQVKTPREIASEMGVKRRLVSAHILNIKEKVFFRIHGTDRIQGETEILIDEQGKRKKGKWIIRPEENVSMIEVIKFATEEFPNENRSLPGDEIWGYMIYKCINRLKISWEKTAISYIEDKLVLIKSFKDYVLKVRDYYYQNDSSIARTAIRFKLEHFEVEEILTIKLDDLT